MSKKPWTPADIALAGLSSLSCAVIVFGTYVFLVVVGDMQAAWAKFALIVLMWVFAGVGLLLLSFAGVAKLIGVGVRSAQD